MKLQFLASDSKEIGSSRIRAWDVAKAYGVDADCVEQSRSAWKNAEADVVVVQEIANPRKHELKLLPERADALKAKGSKVVWDLADPLWYWSPDVLFAEAVKHIDTVVVNCDGLRDQLLLDHGVKAVVIPDRLPRRDAVKVHTDVKVPTLLWFGFYGNRTPCLSQWYLTRKRLIANDIPFNLAIMDDSPNMPMWGYSERVTYLKWSEEAINLWLAKADIALLPTYPGLWGKLKSDNKTQLASWAGLPTVDGRDYNEVKQLLTDTNLRQVRGYAARKKVEAFGDVSKSAAEWHTLVESLVT